MTDRPRLLTVMGSGETAPTMAKVHRLLVERLGSPAVDAVLLDTPYGFQENAEELSRRTAEYFARSVGAPLAVATWRTPSDDMVRREQALSRIRSAAYVFAGPGSPTYALRVWTGSGLRDVLAGTLDRGGCVTFASAAAATLGVVTVPVYEIYKAGFAPSWVAGLDLLAVTGLRAAVVPHYDNAEGGTHDTRFCYLGERRLRVLESMLDDDTVVLGIDEHTAVVFDLDARTAEVLGRGTVTARRRGISTVFGTGCVVPVDELRAAAAGRRPPGLVRQPERPAAAVAQLSLRAERERLERAFDAGLRSGDMAGAVRATLELEQTIVDWSADPEETDGPEAPRAALRGMVVRLGELAAVGARDPLEPLTPLVDTVIELREQARAAGAWTLADTLRTRLARAGIEVRDTAEGPVWLPAPRGAPDDRC